MRWLVWTLFLVGACAPRPAAPPPTAPLVVPKLGKPAADAKAPRDRQSTPEDARDFAIELLERQQYEELIQKLVSPSELERLAQKEGGLGRLVSEFSKSDKPTDLLESLKSVKGVQPETSEEGTRARFASPEKGDGRHRDITFERVDDRWYIRN